MCPQHPQVDAEDFYTDAHQDNANIYSNGESERMFAKAIKKYNIPRDKLVIMTKCFNPVGESPEIKPDEIRDQQDPNYTNKGGLSRLAIFNQVNAVSFCTLGQCIQLEASRLMSWTDSLLKDWRQTILTYFSAIDMITRRLSKKPWRHCTI